MKKFIIQMLVLLLAFMPILGSISGSVFAATSRVAIIKELKGTVKVKKAGGSKEFTAFLKMSLNSGDILMVGAESSAVLQFANGTSEDDQMAASANSTLTFSKLSDKNGTTTKVSLLKGSVWSSVKSIKTKDDQFTLETPTAVMGVRGTNLFVGVNPVTGDSLYAIASGVGYIHPKKARTANEQDLLLFPYEQITLYNLDNQSITADDIIPLDYTELVQQVDPIIIKTIIQFKEAIDKENEQYLDALRERFTHRNGLQPTGGRPFPSDIKTVGDLERLSHNLDNLVGNLVKSAIAAHKIDKSQVMPDVNEANLTLTKKLNLDDVKPPELTDKQKQRQEELRKKHLEREDKVKKQQELDELKRKQDELMKQIAEQKKKLEEANKKSDEQKKKQAKEEYEKLLAELERLKFLEDSKKREEELKNQMPTPSPSKGTGGGSYSPPAETPAEPPVETPAEPPVETPAEPPVETPAEPPVETPAEPPVETPAEPPVETPAEPPVETPAEPPVETPAEPPVETPAEPPVETPAEPPVETPAEPPVETPAEPDPEAPPGLPSGVLSWSNSKDIDFYQTEDGRFLGMYATGTDSLEFTIQFIGRLKNIPIKVNVYDTRTGVASDDTSSNGTFNLKKLAQGYTILTFQSSVAGFAEGWHNEFSICLMNGIDEPDWKDQEGTPFSLLNPYQQIGVSPDIIGSMAYTVNVDNDIASLHLYHEWSADVYPDRIMRVKGDEKEEVGASGEHYFGLDLNYGSNVFIVYVKDISGLFEQEYTLTVNRASPPGGITDWSIVSNGIVTKGLKKTKREGLDANDVVYYTNLDSSTKEITFRMTVDPTYPFTNYMIHLANREGGYAPLPDSNEVSEDLTLRDGANHYVIELTNYSGSRVSYDLYLIVGSDAAPTLTNQQLDFYQSDNDLDIYQTDEHSYSVRAYKGDGLVNLDVWNADFNPKDMKVILNGLPVEGGWPQPWVWNYSFENLKDGANQIEIMIANPMYPATQIYKITIFYGSYASPGPLSSLIVYSDDDSAPLDWDESNTGDFEALVGQGAKLKVVRPKLNDAYHVVGLYPIDLDGYGNEIGVDFVHEIAPLDDGSGYIVDISQFNQNGDRVLLLLVIEDNAGNKIAYKITFNFFSAPPFSSFIERRISIGKV